MGYRQGRPFRGELSSANASTPAALTLFEQGSRAAFTLASNEYVEIHSVSLVTAPGGAASIFLSSDGTESTGETVISGTFGANGGIAEELVVPVAGNAGESIYATAPAGQLDVSVRGTVRREGDGTNKRPSWRESKKGSDTQ